MEIKTAKVIQTSTTQYIHITLKTNSSDIHYFLLNKTLSSASSSSKTSKGSSDPLSASGYNIMVNLTGGNVTAFDVYFERAGKNGGVFFSVRSTAVWFDRIKFVRFERQFISLKLDAYS